MPHSARVTQQLIGSFGWEQMNHPPYSPDLAPSDFHLFLHLKRFLSGRSFDEDEKVKGVLTSWLTSQAATFYNTGIQNLVSRYDKCLNVLVDYVEK
ncbi:Histone-lysine N-methyltransferase SETMAR [Araneus ventricosus]|uniref:Histone-lysine N-methyltransferase SETMAR n=1 Tax=Araneus ventricosus TaxID=182803 RepID=A0A4Y2X894_ARAVE|nr:Histone-lysine N-methyltransferase SETMAR [Araneus ventricosus]